MKELIEKLNKSKSYRLVSKVAEAIYQDCISTCEDVWSEDTDDDDAKVGWIMEAIEDHYVGEIISDEVWSFEVKAPNGNMISVRDLVFEEVLGGVS